MQWLRRSWSGRQEAHTEANTEAEDVLPKGTRCKYVDGIERHTVEVEAVHHDDSPPYYTIRLNGSTRNTTRDKLEPVKRKREEEPASPAALGTGTSTAGTPDSQTALGRAFNTRGRENDSDGEDPITLARSVMRNACCKHSQYQVGACLQTAEGRMCIQPAT